MEEAIVLDVGSLYTKAGSAKDSLTIPPVVSPSLIFDKGIGKAKHAVKHANFVDWDATQALLDDIFYEKIGWRSGEEAGILVAESIFPSRGDREQLTKLLFEHNNASALLICDTASLSMYAMGKLSGVVLDVGYDKTDIAAVVDGQLIPPSCCRVDRGMKVVHDALHTLVSPNGASSDNRAVLDARCCDIVAVQRSGVEGGTTEDEVLAQTCTLPDGQEISLGSKGFQPAEELLEPGLGGSSRSESFAYHLTEAWQSIPDLVLRKAAIDNLLVCGGGSSLQGLPQRVLKDFNACLPPATSCALLHPPDYLPEKAPHYAAWVGGSVLVKALAQPNQYFTRYEYNEAGPSAIHRRCL